MISATQDDAIKLLRELVELHPGARLGQLFAWLGVLGEDQFDRSIWDIDDDQMLAVMRRHREELANSEFASQQIVEEEPLTEAQKAEIDRRLALWDADPQRGIPVEVVFKELAEKFG